MTPALSISPSNVSLVKLSRCAREILSAAQGRSGELACQIWTWESGDQHEVYCCGAFRIFSQVSMSLSKSRVHRVQSGT